MTDIILPEVFIMDKVGIVLVDGVVGEMHASVAVVGVVRWLVLGGCQAGQALFVDVDR